MLILGGHHRIQLQFNVDAPLNRYKEGQNENWQK